MIRKNTCNRRRYKVWVVVDGSRPCETYLYCYTSSLLSETTVERDWPVAPVH